jgi:hypothetical protein
MANQRIVNVNGPRLFVVGHLCHSSASIGLVPHPPGTREPADRFNALRASVTSKGSEPFQRLEPLNVGLAVLAGTLAVADAHILGDLHRDRHLP